MWKKPITEKGWSGSMCRLSRAKNIEKREREKEGKKEGKEGRKAERKEGREGGKKTYSSLLIPNQQ
jgi:hypothetical protein